MNFIINLMPFLFQAVVKPQRNFADEMEKLSLTGGDSSLHKKIEDFTFMKVLGMGSFGSVSENFGYVLKVFFGLG